MCAHPQPSLLLPLFFNILCYTIQSIKKWNAYSELSNLDFVEETFTDWLVYRDIETNIWIQKIGIHQDNKRKISFQFISYTFFEIYLLILILFFKLKDITQFLLFLYCSYLNVFLSSLIIKIKIIPRYF